jgi:EAL domain-containing protein (putative c-di-GMP-specific phosphodiesterase class I)
MHRIPLARRRRRIGFRACDLEGAEMQHGATGYNVVKPAAFGHPKMKPRACVVERKPHVRGFLADALQELGFTACQCEQRDDVADIVERLLPELVLLGVSDGSTEGIGILSTLASKRYGGRILLVGPRHSALVAAFQDFGQELGLAMLPVLPTPFDEASLRTVIASLLPADEPPSTVVDVAEALGAGWLALWYEARVDLRTLGLGGAEALLRLRHPSWGVVEPSGFVPDDNDPNFRRLSGFVIERAFADWRDFAAERGPVALAVTLPIDVLRDPQSVDSLCRNTPADPAFPGLTVGISGAELARDLPRLRDVAAQVRFHGIGLSIGDLGAAWPTGADVSHFPFVEIKADRRFVAGCADDRSKRAICQRILKLAASVGARAVAEGVETRSDYLCVRELGFDMAQGMLFAHPLPADRFARTVLGRPTIVKASGNAVPEDRIAG